jgi:hypothetical protein
MPGQNGVELYQKLREQNPALRVLFCSGYAEELVQSRGVLVTKHNYLAKPFTREALASKVQAALLENPSERAIRRAF